MKIAKLMGLVLLFLGAQGVWGQDITLTNESINENAGANGTVGTLNASGGNGNYTFSLVSGGEDFNISGTSLQANNSFDFETQPHSYDIQIKAADDESFEFEKKITITITDVSEYADPTPTPAAGSTLTGSSQTISWTAVVGASAYELDLGTAAGGSNIYNGTSGTSRSIDVTGLPVNGSTVYVRIITTDVAGPHNFDYTYNAFAAPTITKHPRDTTVIEETPGQFSVSATGTGTLSYQWQIKRNNGSGWSNVTEGTGGTTATYTTPATKPSDDKDEFRCVVSNSGGSVNSDPAVLTVIKKLEIAGPSDWPANHESPATFRVTAKGGTGTYTFQWQINKGTSWADTIGATLDSLRFTAYYFQDGDQYRCIVKSDPQSDTSVAAILTVTPPPLLVTDPRDTTVNNNTTATFRVTASGGTEEYTYQWQEQTLGGSWTNKEGATNAAYSFTVSSAQNGNQYHCVVKSEDQTVTSNAATLHVEYAPVITAHPVSQTTGVGGTITFTVAADGNPAPTYQWYKNTQPMTGKTTPTLELTNIPFADNNAQYYAIASNSKGTAQSNTATLTVTTAPVITPIPDQSITLGGAFTSITLDNYVSDADDLDDQITWTHSGGSAATINVVITNRVAAITAAPGYTGFVDITFTAKDPDNLTAQDIVRFSVLAPLQITTQPQSQEKIVGEVATFSVVASGGITPYTYQWQKYIGSTWSNISGKTAAAFTIDSVILSDAGSFLCVVKDNNGASLNSSDASLTVYPKLIITQHPAAQTKTVGESVSFTVAASGGKEPYRYQWQKNSGNTWPNIQNATAATYTINPVEASHAGNYRCAVFDANNLTINSNAAQLTVYAPLTITLQPTSQARLEGQSVAFAVKVTGGKTPYKYQWQKLINAAWSNIQGATLDSLKINPVRLSDGGDYRCIITDDKGTVINSDAAKLTVNPTVLSIINHPQNISVPVNTNASFSVSASGGTTPYGYQWQKSSNNTTWTNITSATAATYSIGSVAFTDSGYFRCIVSDNASGSVASNSAKLTVYPPVVVTTHPVSQTKWSGDSVQLSIQVIDGTGSYTYQWQRNQTNITGETMQTFKRTNLQTTNAGSYRCIVTSGLSRDTSNEAVLTVYQTAQVTADPTDVISNAGQLVRFFIKAIGEAPVQYQWQKNNTAVANATDDTLTIQSATQNDEGAYRCIVKNGGGSDTSAAAQLSLKGPATVTKNPVSDTVFTGGIALFDVIAGGTLPITYQWQKNLANIASATLATYKDSAVTLSDSGNYRCIVSNAEGKDTTNQAKLTVFQTVYLTGHPDSLTVNPGQSAAFNVVANGQAPILYQWQKNGVDIPGASAATYTITSVKSADAGLYRCRASNGGGEVFSKQGLLNVNGPAVVVNQPRDTIGWTGNSITFKILATGTSPITYQWQKGGAAIPGANNTNYTIANLTLNNAGFFRCIASNPAGADTSDSAGLIVNETVEIISQLSPKIVYEGESATFKIETKGSDPITYQWQKNGFNITSGSLQTLTLDKATAADAGTYRCIAKNGGGSDTSNSASLKVLGAGITLLVPNGGEIWGIGKNYKIQWKTAGNIDSLKNIKIEFSTNGGEIWEMIIDSTANTGSYTWAVPSTVSEFCKIRISDIIDDFPADESDSLFTVKPIVAINEHPVKPKVAPLVSSLVPVPNPVNRNFDREVRFLFTPNKDIDKVMLKVYDAVGNLLFEHATDNYVRYKNGTQYTLCTWNLKNRLGRTVAGGTYLVVVMFKARTGETATIKRLVGIKE